MTTKEEVKEYLINNIKTEKKYQKDKFLIVYYLGNSEVGCVIYQPIYANMNDKEPKWYQWEALCSLLNIDSTELLSTFMDRESAENHLRNKIIESIDEMIS